MVGQILLSLVFGLLLFVILLIGGIIGYQLRYAGKIFPGVKVVGIDVSGLKPAEASALAQAQFTYQKAGRLLLQDQDKAWLAAPVDLGLYLDPETTASAAYEIGRSGTIGDRLSAQFQAWREGVEIAPALVFDQRTASSLPDRPGVSSGSASGRASLSLNGIEVDVRTPASPAANWISRQPSPDHCPQVQTLRDGSVPLVVNPTQPAILDVSAEAEQGPRVNPQPAADFEHAGKRSRTGTVHGPSIRRIWPICWVFERSQLDNNTAEYRLVLRTGYPCKPSCRIFQPAFDRAPVTMPASLSTTIPTSWK